MDEDISRADIIFTFFHNTSKKNLTESSDSSQK
jgi:hypothetical protein